MLKSPVHPSVSLARRMLAAAMLCPVLGAADVNAAVLEVSVSGIQEIRGTIAIVVFDSVQSFDARVDAVAQARVPISDKRVFWSTELPSFGTYAVIVYQDLDDDGEIDMSAFGRPQEPYGFSNNVRGRFGPPGFEAVKFEVEEETMSIDIRIG